MEWAVNFSIDQSLIKLGYTLIITKDIVLLSDDNESKYNSRTGVSELLLNYCFVKKVCLSGYLHFFGLSFF